VVSPERPEAVLGTTRWVTLFRSVGFAVDGSVVSALSDVVELHRRVA
jgi:hypothetical protein